jgi:tRNA threonylcarbamoyladenosine biosynthesis protein TsaB
VLVLALDTTSEQGGAGIYRDQQCLASVENPGPANLYSVTLFQMVERLLGEARLTLGDIELFAVAIGPGSFTGIRVGVAATQGWASALHRPVKGISVLEAMVEAAQPKTDWAVPILDARRGEVYAGLFRRWPPQALFQPEGEGFVLKPDALRSFLEELARSAPGRAVTCVVRQCDRLSEAWRESLPASFHWQSVAGSLVAAMARLALRAGQEGRLQSPAELDAYYIRRPDAELPRPRGSEQHEKAKS